MQVTDLRRAPFDRVENGYDPHQVAAFAAEALTWKRDLAATRKALAETLVELEHHISLVTSPDDDAGAELNEQLHRESFQPTPFEQPDTESTTFGQTDSERSETRMAPTPLSEEEPSVDPLDAIFENTLEPEPEETDPAVLREQRVAAAAANLWKRRGVLTPQE